MIKYFRKIFLLFITIVSGYFVFLNPVYAEDFSPEIVGTISNIGDSVNIKDVDNNNPKWVKYVSPTDDLVYVYTDSKVGNTCISIYDQNEKYLAYFSGLKEIDDKDGNYYDPANTNNLSNTGIYIKMKKGSVYYFKTYTLGSGLISYSIKLIKPEIKPTINVNVIDYSKGVANPVIIDENEYKKLGISYDDSKSKLTLNNCKMSYSIQVTASPQTMFFADSLVDIEIIGDNEIYPKGIDILQLEVSAKILGNGTLTITQGDNNTDYNIFSYYLGAYVSLIIDGPTIEMKNDYVETFIVADNLVFNSGKLIVSGISYDDCIDAGQLIVNGGEITQTGFGENFFAGGDVYINDGNIVISAKNTNDIISCDNIEINGGNLNINLYETSEFYSSAIYTYETVVVNGGNIVVKYIDPTDTESKLAGYRTIDSADEIKINGGNFYILKSDNLKEVLGEEVFGIYVYEEGDNKETDKIFVSDKANIITASSIDISKFNYYLEYNLCIYDGSYKTPKVYVDGLVEDIDYTVSYSDNKEIGTAKVKITGKGFITGSINTTFEIKSAPPKSGSEIKDKKYIYKVKKAGSLDGSTVGELQVTGLRKKSLKTIKIAAFVTINGIKYKVTSIGAKAFKGNKKITKVIIGKKVKSIGANAFAKCIKVKQVSINSTVLKSIGKNAFNGDKKLTKVIIKTKKLKKIGKKAFYRKGGKKITFVVPKSKKKAYKKLLKKSKTNKYKVK